MSDAKRKAHEACPNRCVIDAGFENARVYQPSVDPESISECTWPGHAAIDELAEALTRDHAANEAAKGCPEPSESREEFAKRLAKAYSLAVTTALVAPYDRDKQGWLAVADVLSTFDYSWRKLLWLGHGHVGLYGDDGEMQCVHGLLRDHAWDFKNDTPERIWKHVCTALKEGVDAEKVREALYIFTHDGSQEGHRRAVSLLEEALGEGK